MLLNFNIGQKWTLEEVCIKALISNTKKRKKTQDWLRREGGQRREQGTKLEPPVHLEDDQ